MGGFLEEETFKLGIGSYVGLSYAEMRGKGISEDEIVGVKGENWDITKAIE